MNRYRLLRLALVLGVLAWGIHLSFGQSGTISSTPIPCVVNGTAYADCTPGQVKQAQREAARLSASPQQKGVNTNFAGLSPTTATESPLAPPSKLKPTGPPPLVPTAAMTVGAVPDYYGVGNYANSPLPVVNANGGIVAGTGMRKFVDTLPQLCPVLAANDLGQCIPLATPDTTTFPGNDFYRIGLKEYQKQMHADLPAGALATKLRGYVQLDFANNPVRANQYLGLLILATRNRPVRILFKNMIGSNLNIPVDTTYMGAGLISTNGTSQMASQKRADLHLHGGNTPWISDGTPHQWITPAGGDGQPSALGFSKGYSFVNVPDMAPPLCTGLQCVIPTPTLTDGLQTYYWTNKQGGRLMFFHDHAFGLTRLNVYAGEAAGYLLVDPAEETALKAATVPGTIITNAATGAIVSADLAHRIPLVIQDKTFVPDNGTGTASQLAAQDPTWDVTNWGGFGSLWFPHVYTPNQNPADLTGANGFGRWDWGPWFFPPQAPSSLTLQSYACTSVATPTGGAWAFPPLMCPGVPDPTRPAPANSPSGTPESFMDTMVVNGTAYPSLTVDPTAYRFDVLSVGNDRTLNLGLYVADPLAVSVTAGGTGYANPPAAPPLVSITGCTFATATASVVNGSVAAITMTYPGTGPGCTGTPTVTIAAPPAPVAPATATQAYAIVSVNTEVRMVPAVSAAARPATLPNCSGAQPTMNGGGLITALLDANGKPLNNTGLPLGCWPLYSSTVGFTAGPLGEAGILSWGNSDGRLGGLPDPTTAGPPIIQIGTEGGLLPAPAVIPSTALSYDYNKRSITVLNVLNHDLLLGPAERADIIIDFTAFAGKTLILYNDSPAPVPAADPRVDYFTNDPDNSATGGATSTMAGYGPNIRTVMQIRVNPAIVGTTPATPFSLPALMNPATGLPAIFAATQDPIIVPEPAYPAGHGNGLADYARIQDTSLTLNTAGPLCSVPPCVQPMLPKAIQELFTLDYGRMNATLGVEVPLTNFINQTTIPYGYADPPTELFKNGETQIWKITHNGVDTHFMHFHLFNVQVINRVGWDGAVKPPDPNELSFKDTVRMNPLEDVIVALKPMTQDPFPFPVPNSIRPLNVTMPLGTTSTTAYTNLDPTNAPAAVVNDMVNFGWEYVWHCHILGHEENDMMRAMILAVAPNAPLITRAVRTGSQVSLVWTETVSPPYTSFTIQRSLDPTFPVGTSGTASFTVGPTPLTYTDTVAGAGPWYYRMLASNLVGYTRTYAAPAAGYPNVSSDSAWSVNHSTGTAGGPPVVHIDVPAQGSIIAGSTTVSGWAISYATGIGLPISSVQVLVDGTVVGNATYGSLRPDVCAVYPGRPNCPNVGYTYTLNASTLSAGSHTIRAVATDSSATPLSSFAQIQVTH